MFLIYHTAELLCNADGHLEERRPVPTEEKTPGFLDFDVPDGGAGAELSAHAVDGSQGECLFNTVAPSQLLAELLEGGVFQSYSRA